MFKTYHNEKGKNKMLLTKEKYIIYVKDNNEIKYLTSDGVSSISFYTASQMELFHYKPKEFKSELSAKRWYKQMSGYDFPWLYNSSKRYSVDEIKILKITYKTTLK